MAWMYGYPSAMDFQWFNISSWPWEGVARCPIKLFTENLKLFAKGLEKAAPELGIRS